MFIKLASLVLYVTMVINMNFLSTISVHRQQKTLWELINRSLMGKCFDFVKSNSLNWSSKEMYGYRCGEFVCGYWAWRVKETSGRRGLANPPLVLRAKDFTFQGRIRGNFVANYFSHRDNHMFSICVRRLPSLARKIPTAMRAEVIIVGFPKIITIFNIPGI